jgi:formylglycine-generating enzyme required for sulfatase activity/nucleoside phosphorylase
MTTNVQSDSILIVTVTKVEAQAVLRAFSQNAKWTRENFGGKFYYFLGFHGNAPVCMVQSEMGTATPGGSLLTVHQAIQDLHPQAIIMCGIAFGLRPDKQKLGDILVSRQLQYYESQKVDLERGQIPRGDRVTSAERLIDRFRSSDVEWQGASTHFGLVLSGEKLVNDPSFRKWLLKAEPEAIGGEMEGAGLYVAARDAKVDWILVKAICDWADGSKNDGAQVLAAENAAQFVLRAVQLGGWGGSVENSSSASSYNGSDKLGPTKQSLASPEQSPLLDIAFDLDYMVKGLISNDSSYHDTLSHLEAKEPEGDGIFHREIRKKLQHIMSDQACSVTERAKAGDALAQLGDPRFRSDAWFLPDEDLLGFIEVPGGPFIMGADGDTNGGFISREGPQHSVSLPTFYMSRYPVTVAQYQVFLAETFHDLATKSTGLKNHPMVSVSWNDARQYCQWLTGQLRARPEVSKHITSILSTYGNGAFWTITLPSEAEWEKAARGMFDARVYPWGAQVDPCLANYHDTGLFTTSAVGCFERGCSPYKIQDLSGNVWEWTRSNWGTNIEKPEFKYPYKALDGRENLLAPNETLRVQRGGAFYSSAEEIRCSFRRADSPNAKHDHVGFRLTITLLPQQVVYKS